MAGLDPIDQWWEGTREGRLLVQQCTACGHHQHYPRHLCTRCGGTDGLAMVAASGRATVWSFTVVHRAPSDEVQAPYTVALVRLSEGPVMLTWLDFPDPVCDEPVEVSWGPMEGTRQRPVFVRPAP